MSNVSLNLDIINRIIGLLSKSRLPSVKVGILADTNHRSDSNVQTNAQIGFKNEFGDFESKPQIPERSFIRMPLRLYFNAKMQEKKSLTGKQFEKALQDGTIDKFAEKVGLVAEEVIQESFETRGWGVWPKNAPLTIALKGSDAPLIDTGQLRRAITSKVIK